MVYKTQFLNHPLLLCYTNDFILYTLCIKIWASICSARLLTICWFLQGSVREVNEPMEVNSEIHLHWEAGFFFFYLDDGNWKFFFLTKLVVYGPICEKWLTWSIPFLKVKVEGVAFLSWSSGFAVWLGIACRVATVGSCDLLFEHQMLCCRHLLHEKVILPFRTSHWVKWILLGEQSNVVTLGSTLSVPLLMSIMALET